MAGRTLARRKTRETSSYQAPEEETAKDADEGEQKPRRGGRRLAKKAEEDEDDEDEAPRQRPTAKKGWDGYDSLKGSDGQYPEFKPGKEEVLIKILDDAPFATYRQHWIERPGKKSWTCIEEDCPLCDRLGDKPRKMALFNVYNIDDDAVQVWVAGPSVAGILKKRATNDKTKPINRDDLYWTVTSEKPKGGGAYKYTIDPVKARDLSEDFGMDPISEEDLADIEAGCFDDDVVIYPLPKTLRDIASEQLDEDD